MLCTNQNIELLPPLGKVDLVVAEVRVANVDEGEVLQHQPDVGDAGRGHLRQRGPKQGDRTQPRLRIRFYSELSDLISL